MGRMEKALGAEEKKRLCGCAVRGVFLDSDGNSRRKRMHRKTCHFFKAHRHLNRKYGESVLT